MDCVKISGFIWYFYVKLIASLLLFWMGPGQANMALKFVCGFFLQLGAWRRSCNGWLRGALFARRFFFYGPELCNRIVENLVQAMMKYVMRGAGWGFGTSRRWSSKMVLFRIWTDMFEIIKPASSKANKISIDNKVQNESLIIASTNLTFHPPHHRSFAIHNNKPPKGKPLSHQLTNHHYLVVRSFSHW